MMRQLEKLKLEVSAPPAYAGGINEVLCAEGFTAHYDAPSPLARAYGIERLFTDHPKYIYPHDRIAGAWRGNFIADVPEAALRRAKTVLESYGRCTFLTNWDHFAPDYAGFLQEGVSGVLKKISKSMEQHQSDPDAEKKLIFLEAARISMTAFGKMAAQYGDAAAKAAKSAAPEEREDMLQMAQACWKVASEPPQTFREALQLIWLAHVAFLWEGRYAMAFGRMDQFLYPYYRRDRESGSLTQEDAVDLLSCALYKIADAQKEDVCNIVIGGVLPDGTGGVNELSYLILEAVKRCGIPGPNLSARIYKEAPEEFLDACLQVIGTGIGYPALMNDEVNISALARHGYKMEDCHDYCMVGCIENFLAGKQPPWSDGRYNSPKYLELALNDGRCLQTGVQIGPRTGTAETILSMEDFMSRLHLQMEAGASEYMAFFRNEADRYKKENYAQPFLSCFCTTCIERGLDVNDGGTEYPSVHGAGCMGIATVSDSLAAIERVVFEKKLITLPQLRDALAANFEGYDHLRTELIRAPKYGNNDDFVDKYAVWYVEEHARLFDHYRTPDGGAVYTAIASNVNNIPAGLEVAATPDGRRNREPVSDAASPMHGMDKEGPTAVVLSTTKPNYTLVSCGTVLNQKYSPSVFIDPEKRAKLRALIRVYFHKGGQEMQINSVSRDILKDAMKYPDRYRSLVVRVSGFSAFYTRLEPAVQEDILLRTEQA